MTVDQPRVFMSYSWTTPEYAERVVALAEQLSADGVHVILDRWDLREGQDKHKFMEEAVTDPAVHRVLILCDPTYAAKANDRQGDVGTETLIISTEVYREAKQEKFVPVIMERDDAGQVVVPTYLNGRIYVDLSDPDHSEPEYEKLVRNIFGKPELTRPALGRPPAYIDQRETALVTGRSLAAFRDAVLRDRPHQAGLLDDYLSRLTGALRAEVIADAESLQDLDVRIIDALTRFLPYREEYFQLLDFVVRGCAIITD